MAKRKWTILAAAVKAVLKGALRRAGYRPAGEGVFTARRRHLQALSRAAVHLDAAAPLLAARDGELAAEELRGAQQALAEITGAFGSEDLLGRKWQFVTASGNQGAWRCVQICDVPPPKSLRAAGRPAVEGDGCPSPVES